MTSVLPLHLDEDALRLLRECAVTASALPPTSLAVARAFRRAAGALRDRGHLPSAVLCGRHELAVHRRRDDDPDATASTLLDLSRTYRAQGRLHKVVDCADQTLETYGRHHHTDGFTRTLAHLGSLMLEACRPGAAVGYLTRAADRSRLAEHQALLSRACRVSDDHRTADRHLNRSLATALRTGERAVRHVRELADGTRGLAPPVP